VIYSANVVLSWKRCQIELLHTNADHYIELYMTYPLQVNIPMTLSHL